MEKLLINKRGEPVFAAITDLKKSGLTKETIEAAGIKIFHGRQDDLKKILGFANMNKQSILHITDLLQFPYFNQDGSIALSRFKPVPQIDDKRKYLHPLGQPAIPYILPPVWAVKDKTNKPIWITEGEKKGLKLIQHGRHAIALPGVWAFKAGKDSDVPASSKEWWASLRLFSWHGRTVYLAFDMDLWTNPQVRYAQYELAVKLLAFGALVKFPKWEEGKGIDDYLVARDNNPEESLSQLEENAKALEDFAEAGHQAELLRALAKVNLSPILAEQITQKIAKTLKVNRSTVKKQLAALKGKQRGGMEEFFNRFVLIRATESVIDNVTKKAIKVRALGLEFPDMIEVWRQSTNKTVIDAEKIVFKPQGCAEDEINLFRGVDFQPKAGPVDTILELIRHLCLDDDELMHWLLCWLAYPLQNVGAKMRTTVVFHGGQGSGKNLIFQDLMCGIYKDYSTYLTQERLEDKYTDWMSGKLFIVCDEVLANKGKGRYANQLKTYITQPIAPVRRMYEPAREEENHANFVFLSNETLPVLIEPDDRRYVVIRQENKLEKDFYKKCAGKIYGGGQQAFADFLLKYKLGDFNEHTEPMMTAAKEELIALCEPGPIRFAKLWAAGELEFPYCTCTSEQLYNAFVLWNSYSNEYGSTSFQRFSTEMGRVVNSRKITGIAKGKPRCSSGGKVSQRKGWIVDLRKEIWEQYFAANVFEPTEIDQTGRFQVALEEFREKIESTRVRFK